MTSLTAARFEPRRCIALYRRYGARVAEPLVHVRQESREKSVGGIVRIGVGW